MELNMVESEKYDRSRTHYNSDLILCCIDSIWIHTFEIHN